MDSSMHRPSDLDCWFPLSTSKLLRSGCLKSIISQIHGMSYKDTPRRFHQLFEQITLQPECMMLCCSLVQAGSSLFITVLGRQLGRLCPDFFHVAPTNQTSPQVIFSNKKKHSPRKIRKKKKETPSQK